MLAQRREQRPLEAHLVPPDRRQHVGGHLGHGLAARGRARNPFELFPNDRRAELGDDVLDCRGDLGTDAVARDQRDGPRLGIADRGDVGDEGANLMKEKCFFFFPVVVEVEKKERIGRRRNSFPSTAASFIIVRFLSCLFASQQRLLLHRNSNAREPRHFAGCPSRGQQPRSAAWRRRTRCVLPSTKRGGGEKKFLLSSEAGSTCEIFALVFFSLSLDEIFIPSFFF